MVVIAVEGAVLVTVVGASDKWLAAIFITVVTFGAVISYCRSRWKSKTFWNVLIGVFLIHLALIYLVFAVILKRRSDIGLLVCAPIILVESSLVYYAVMFVGAIVLWTGCSCYQVISDNASFHRQRTRLRNQQRLLRGQILRLCHGPLLESRSVGRSYRRPADLEQVQLRCE